jgi:hypothetical protein
LLLGATGFACGFFGPMLLNPDANQGPMLGIFITGPGGALLGLLLGTVFKWLPLNAHRKWLALFGVCAGGALTIIYFCFPEPLPLGYVVDGQIRSCSAPSEHMHEAIEYWQKRLEAAPWATPRAGWRQDTERMLNDEGAVLSLAIHREATVLKHRKPWNRGKVTLTSWQTPRPYTTFFARFNGSDCASYPQDLGLLYVAYGQGSSSWPPTDLQNFLNLPLIDPVPGRYQALLP